MKKIQLFLMGLVILGLGSCAKQYPTAAEVATRIDSHQALTQGDYTTMIDYCGDYAKAAQRYFDIINEQSSDSTGEYSRAVSELASLRAANPYLDMFQTAIYAADDSQLGNKNVEKVNEYQKYQAFPLPDGSGASLNTPGVEGEIMDMPSNQNSHVIATPDGEAVK